MPIKGKKFARQSSCLKTKHVIGYTLDRSGFNIDYRVSGFIFMATSLHVIRELVTIKNEWHHTSDEDEKHQDKGNEI